MLTTDTQQPTKQNLTNRQKTQKAIDLALSLLGILGIAVTLFLLLPSSVVSTPNQTRSFTFVSSGK